MFGIVLALLAAFAAPENLLQNPSFTAGLGAWRAEAGPATIDLVPTSEGPAVSVRADRVEGYPRLVQDFAAQPGAIYGAEVLAQDLDIRSGYGAYLTLEFHDAENKRLHFEQSSPAIPGKAWSRLLARCAAPANAVRGSVCLVLRGAGEARFRAPMLHQLDPPPPLPGDAVVSLQVGAPLPTRFLGFGVEDDGWLANGDNAAKGVTEEDIAHVHDRTVWLNPALVRMFCWHNDWNPAGDWTTFDFDSPNMRGRYRALDLYQRLGAAVNITGVEWNRKAPWAQPEAMAKAIGELFTELVQRRGYTCIKQWTLTNEPNTHFAQRGGTFEIYTRIHTLVAAEFRARGLDIAVVGSDDTNGGLPWFEQCVATPAYFDTAALMASHFYLQQDSLRAVRFHLSDRLNLLAGRKPFIIAEFGFQDARAEGALVNPLMDEFDYALLSLAFASEATAMGTAGMTIWCLHQVYYPNDWFMTYGLWRYKTEGWAPRPIFHAWALLTRGTRPGDAVRPLVGALPAGVQAVVIGNTLFAVNSNPVAITLKVEGLPLLEALWIQEADLPAPDAPEAVQRAVTDQQGDPVADATLVLPPRSFGRAK